MLRSTGLVTAGRLVGSVAAAALVVGLVPAVGAGAEAPVLERRTVGKSVILVASEPRPHAKPTKRASSTVSDFDGDGVDDLAVAGDTRFLVAQADRPSGAVAVRYSSVQREDLLIGVTETTPAVCADFGEAALATGDFNRDGRDDLVVSETCESTTGTSGYATAGAVWVFPGSTTGLHLSTARLISRATPGVSGAPVAGEYFGQTLATGDLDADGYADLAVGSPRSTVGGRSSAGSVVVLYGGQDGLTGAGSTAITQSTAGVPGSAGQNRRFGGGLAIGKVTGDRYPDLVIGIPGNFTHTWLDGAVALAPGGPSGVSTVDASAVTGTALTNVFGGRGGNQFVLGLGAVLVAADLDGDGQDEVVAGSPAGTSGGTRWSGGLVVALGARGGSLTADGVQALSLETAGMPGSSGSSGRFGASLAAADLNGDGRQDLAVGEPGRTVSGYANAGAVYVVHGSAAGLSARGARAITQSTAGVPGAPGGADRFGVQLGLLDLDGSGRRDLVVAAPNDCLTDEQDGEGSGSVTVFRNVWGTLTPDERWGGRVAGITGLTDRLSEFGTQIA